MVVPLVPLLVSGLPRFVGVARPIGGFTPNFYLSGGGCCPGPLSVAHAVALWLYIAALNGDRA